jgi:formylmethanofuran dehydrogenase subunit E
MTRPDPDLLQTLLADSARRHQHLCPRQVLGVRLALHGLARLALSPPAGRFRNPDKRLLVFVETDGCGADGVAVATDCTVGRRTLRVLDYGKLAVTLVDTVTGRAVRVAPAANSRQLALQAAPQAAGRWHAYLEAYQVIPDEQLIVSRPVRLVESLAAILSRPEARTTCARCHEEIFNEREQVVQGQVLCRHCAGDNYYRPV